MADNDILGIVGQLDISDIYGSLKELSSSIGQVTGVSQEMSKRLQDIFQQLGNVTEKELAGKGRDALTTLSQALEEAKTSADKNVSVITDRIAKLQSEMAKTFKDMENVPLSSDKFAQLQNELEGYNTQLSTENELLSRAKEEASALGEAFAKVSNAMNLEGANAYAESLIEKLNEVNKSSETLAKINALKESGMEVDVEELISLLEQYKRECTETSNAASEAYKAQGEYVSQLKEQVESLRKKWQSTTPGTEEAERLQNQYNDLSIQLNHADAVWVQLNKTQKDAAQQAKEAQKPINMLNAEGEKTGEVASATGSKIRKEAKETGKTVKKEADDIDKALGKLQKIAAGYLTFTFAKQFAQKMMSIRGEFQQLEVAFTTMLGSEEKALSLMEQLVKTAAITPFDLKGVAQGAKQLLAYGIEADKVNDILVHLGDIAAGLSLPLNDLVYLYGTTMTQGRMFTQDLRQFMGRGIPIAEELAKQFGVTKDKIGELVTAGKVGAEEFNKAIMAMSSEGGKFAGLMEAQSKTITGQISNIQDSIDVMFNELGKKSEGLINKALSGVSFLIENYETVGKVILTVATAYGTYKAALVAVAAYRKFEQIWEQVKAFRALSESVGMATAAVRAFDTATKTTAVGIIVSAVATAIVAFGLFSSSSNKASAAIEKYGESAVNTINKVDTLTAEVKGLTEGSALQKKVMEELNTILEQYGVTQIQEGDNIDEINQKRERAIELIQQEAIERQRLNNLEIGDNAYKEAAENAKKQLYEDLKDAINWTSNLPEVRENASAITEIISQEVENSIDLIADKEGEEYEKGLKRIFEKIQNKMRVIGLSEETIGTEWLEGGWWSNHENIINKYIDSLKKAQESHISFSRSINAVAQSEVEAIEKPADAAREAADFSQTSTENLVKKIVELKKACDGIEREIDIRIKWGASITFNNDDVLDFTDLRNAEAELRRRINEANSDEAVDNLLKELRTGKAKSIYGSAEREIYNKAITELEKRKSDNSSKKKTSKGKSEEEKRAQQRQKQFELEQRQLEELAKQQRDLMDAQTDAMVAQIRDDAERERAEKEVQFERNIRQIEEQAEQYKKASYQAAKERFDLTNKNKNLTFADTEEGSRGWQGQSLTAEQQGIIEARLQEARTERERQLEEEQRKQEQALYDYITKYGSIQAQRAAITKKYDEEIARTTDAIQKATLQQEKERMLEELNMKEIQGSLNWEVIFNDLNRVSTEALRKLRDDMRNALNSGELSPKNAKVLSEKILEAENEISKRTNIFASMIPALQDRLRITNQIRQAEEDIVRLREQQEKKREEAIISLSQASGVDELFIRQNFESLGLDAQGWINLLGLDPMSEQARIVTQKLSDLGKSTEDVTNKQEQLSYLQKMVSGEMNFKEGIKEIFRAATNEFDPMGIANLANTNIQSLPELIDTIGLSNTEFGEAVGNFADGTASFVGAIQSFASGDFVGGITGIIKGFQSYGRVLGIGGGNAADTMKAIDRLNERNAILTDSIDRLNDTMSKQSGAQAIKTYQEIVKNQKELEKNLKEQLKLQMGYHEAHHSFDYYWNDIKGRDLSNFNNLHNTSWNGSLENLDPETAAAIMADVNLREKIKNTGKGGYGERVLEWIEQLAEQAGKAQEATDALYASLTGTTRDSVFSDFLSQMYDLADGSETVMDDIAKNWQKMVNRMVINNIIGTKVQQQLSDWYDDLAHANEDFSLGKIDETQYQRRLDELNNRYNSIVNNAQKEIEQFTERGIIKPIEDAADATLITIDTIKDGWKEMLMDMSSDTKDWAQDIAKIMTEQLANELIFDEEWKKQQNEWLERYKDAMDTKKYTDSQRKALLEQLQEEQEDWIEENRRKMKAITDMTGYDPSKTSEQSATVQAMERITVDQADELVGRMNAGQMIWEQQLSQQRLLNENILSINDSLISVKDLMRDVPSDIANIAEYQRVSVQHLANIEKNTANLVVMASDLEEIKRTVKNNL